MDNQVVFPDGIRVYQPNQNAPSFVKGRLVINKTVLTAWLQTQPEDVTLDIKEGKKGTLYLAVNTFKPTKQKVAVGAETFNNTATDDLPF